MLWNLIGDRQHILLDLIRSTFITTFTAADNNLFFVIYALNTELLNLFTVESTRKLRVIFSTHISFYFQDISSSFTSL